MSTVVHSDILSVYNRRRSNSVAATWANDEERREAVRRARQEMYAEQAARAEEQEAAAKLHELISPPEGLSHHMRAGPCKASLVPFLEQALAAYLVAFPDQEPTQAEDEPVAAVVDEPEESHAQRFNRWQRERAAREAGAADQLLDPHYHGDHAVMVEQPRRGRGRPRKVVEATHDGFLIED